jgi:hypothetical protein
MTGVHPGRHAIGPRGLEWRAGACPGRGARIGGDDCTVELGGRTESHGNSGTHGGGAVDTHAGRTANTSVGEHGERS